ncbi:coniferyl-alcohol dehydrogenase [Nocardioides zeae]|uniref:SDR family oxidoreductase n=1 Tax=Nocardioides zeae TaxID=1457234 RepID=A0A6P0HG51_9ACTN|nr:coniferyl-alcohol dehydrogenase [Nocardioides zeae]NEN77603.1 SDR family oxidoreductase [Nocardioides zeae]
MPDPDHFRGRRVVVTGAASGIGHAVTARLLDLGAVVHTLDRNEPTLPVDRHVPVDLADRASIDAALAALDDRYDVLLNVAGVPGTAPSDVVMRVNTFAVRHLSEAFLDRLDEGGSVVVVSSTAGFGWPERLDTIKELLATDTYEDAAAWWSRNPQEGNAYNFSKEASTVYVMTMGLAFRELGLRINAVLPGPVETPILADFEESMGKDILDGVRELLGGHATAEDIADAVLFLASDDARWVNGHALIVDGGVSGSVLTGLVPAPEI